MDLTKIKQVVNQDLLSDDQKRAVILMIIAEDKKAIPDLLEMLEAERQIRYDLIIDMNLELSRTAMYLKEFALEDKRRRSAKDGGGLDRPFILDAVKQFYRKYRGIVEHAYEPEWPKEFNEENHIDDKG